MSTTESITGRVITTAPERDHGRLPAESLIEVQRTSDSQELRSPLEMADLIESSTQRRRRR